MKCVLTNTSSAGRRGMRGEKGAVGANKQGPQGITGFPGKCVLVDHLVVLQDLVSNFHSVQKDT